MKDTDDQQVTRPRRVAYIDDVPIVVAPSSFTVDHEYKPVIYLPNGKVLVRRAGF